MVPGQCIVSGLFLLHNVDSDSRNVQGLLVRKPVHSLPKSVADVSVTFKEARLRHPLSQEPLEVSTGNTETWTHVPREGNLHPTQHSTREGVHHVFPFYGGWVGLYLLHAPGSVTTPAQIKGTSNMSMAAISRRGKE